ncbi:NlpC/P60 family protein [Lacibacter sp. H375]|uniref:C40 family peptidase n=1 Tax=Lacibacter sp. H375 TaxID=3133424 RepID=UPI0030BF8DF1
MNSADTVVNSIPDTVLDESQKVWVDSFPIDNHLNNVVDSGKEVSRDQLLAYAKTLIGTPYKYASIDPAEGLDCSGFITHVFNHFSINVPRSSVDFTNYGVPVNLADAETGDLILFSETDTLSKVVGHMGIVTEIIDGELQFIHSTSGKAYAVTISKLNEHYRKRFVKVIRISYARNGKL